MTTGERIYIARKQSGLTQKELGEKLGVSASMIGQYENGIRNPKKKTLERIADALGVSWDELYVFSIEAEQARKLDEIEEIKKQLETAEGKIRAALEYTLEVLMESYEDVTLLDALQGSIWEEFIPENQKGAAIAVDIIKKAGLTVKDKDGNVIHQGDGKPWVKAFPPPTPKERIDAAFGQLNEDGQEKAAESIEIIAGNPKFQRHAPTDAPESAQATQKGTEDTTETEKAPTDAPQRPQEDET